MNEDLKKKLGRLGYDVGQLNAVIKACDEINSLKKEKNAVILAHSYQTPDIIYGVADFVGDSYALSRAAQKADAEIIVFCGVRFMAETAKILNPSKTVLLPAPGAGCSLADSISASDVREMKAENPGVPVICYINTSADVKAECDACCTSSNALKVVEGIPGDSVIFVPDQLMAANLQKLTSKKLIFWRGKCVVHESFDARKIAFLRAKYDGLKILAHSECAPDVVAACDMSGGTGDMIDYVRKTDAKYYMLVTECGMHERMVAEFPDKNFIGMCALCPYMKMTNLQLIKQVLSKPAQSQVVEVDPKVARAAGRTIERMFEISER